MKEFFHFYLNFYFHFYLNKKFLFIVKNGKDFKDYQAH